MLRFLSSLIFEQALITASIPSSIAASPTATSGWIIDLRLFLVVPLPMDSRILRSSGAKITAIISNMFEKLIQTYRLKPPFPEDLQ